MKKLTLLSVVLAIATLTVVAADDAKPKKGGKAPAIPADILKKYDKNGDGKVNKDDNLSKEEMKAFRDEVKKAKESK
jgi:hypothetical protein